MSEPQPPRAPSGDQEPEDDVVMKVIKVVIFIIVGGSLLALLAFGTCLLVFSR